METATYKSKGFIRGSTLTWVIIVSQVCLFAMIPLLFLGLHPFIVTAFFIGAIYFGFQLVTGNIIYTLDEEGLTKEIEPTMMKHFWRKHTFQYFSWDQIKSFRAGRDASRSMEEFNFITINTNDGNKLEINDKKGNKTSFENFVSVFRKYVRDLDEGKGVDTSRPVSARNGEEAPQIRHTIREKPSFYKTPFAMVLTVIFILMIIGLGVMMIASGNLRPANIFRLLIILVPGTLYMVYRVFMSKS